jgi:hypothetical protein
VSSPPATMIWDEAQRKKTESIQTEYDSRSVHCDLYPLLLHQKVYVKHILFGNYNVANYINPYSESLKGYREYSTNTTSTQFGVNQNLDMLL